MADEKKTTPEGPKKFMTGTWQSLVGMAVLGLIVGLIVAAVSSKKYAMFAGIFAVFAVAVTYGTQMLDVKVWKTKDNLLVPPPKAA